MARGKKTPKYRPGFFCQASGCNAPLLWSQTYPSTIKNGWGRFCSVACKNVGIAGENNPNWKGGKDAKTNHRCLVCDKSLTRQQCFASVIKNGGGRFCSYACAGHWRAENFSKENSPSWKGGKQKYFCEVCGKVFLAHSSSKRRFCQRACYSAWRSENIAGEQHPNWTGGKKISYCEFCNKDFFAYVSRWQRFCSVECRGLWLSENMAGKNSQNWKGGEIEQICEVCEVSFFANASRIKNNTVHFCSYACAGTWRSENRAGDKSHAWQGGKSFEPYDVAFNNVLKRQVRERDNYTCVLCTPQTAKIVTT